MSKIMEEEMINPVRHEQPRQSSQQRISQEKLINSQIRQPNFAKNTQQQLQKQNQQLKHASAQRVQQQQPIAKPLQERQTQEPVTTELQQPQTSQMQLQIHKDEQRLREAENLQSKLKIESNRIIEWQVKKEIECRELERKLKESEDIAERQRKNLLDLQMSCEQISQEFQEELANREELGAKVVYSRQICNILQEHFQQLEVTLKSFVSIRDELTARNKDIMEQYDKLSEKFDNIVKTFEKETATLKTMLSKEREQRVNDINEANRIHKLLETKLDETILKLSAAQETCLCLKQELLSSNSRIQELQERYDHLKENLNSAMSEKECLLKDISGLKDVQVTFHNLEKIHKELLQEKELTEKKLESTLSDLAHLQTVNQQNLDLLSKNANEKEDLLHQINVLNESIQQVNDKLNNEIVLKEKMVETISQLESDYNVKSEEMKILQEKYDLDKTELNHLLELKDVEKSGVQSELLTNKQFISDLKELLKQSHSDIEKLENEVKLYENAVADSSKKLQEITAGADQLRAEREQLQHHLQKTETAFTKVTDELSRVQYEKEDLGQTVKELKEDISKIKNENILKAEMLYEKEIALSKSFDELCKVKNEKETLDKEFKEQEALVSRIKTESSLKLKETMVYIDEYKQTYVNQLTVYEEVKNKLEERLECQTRDLKEVTNEKENANELITKKDTIITKLENQLKMLEIDVKKLEDKLVEEKKKNLPTKDFDNSPVSQIRHSSARMATSKFAPRKQNLYESDETDESSIDVSTLELQKQNLKRARDVSFTQSQPGPPSIKKGAPDGMITSSQYINKTKPSSAINYQPTHPARHTTKRFFKRSAIPQPRSIVDTDDVFSNL